MVFRTVSHIFLFGLLLSLLLNFVAVSTSWARNIVPYHRLVLKDLDQMAKIVSDKVKESQKATDNQSVPLEEAFFLVYSRPDDDDMIEKISSPLRNEMEESNQREAIIDRITSEAISKMQKPKGIRPDVLVTYWVLLDNVMGELKSEYKAADTFEEKQLLKIKDARISISSAILNERSLRLMKSSKSPSEAATKVLEDFKAKQKSISK